MIQLGLFNKSLFLTYFFAHTSQVTEELAFTNERLFEIPFSKTKIERQSIMR